jgi:HlyD family secretion protein
MTLSVEVETGRRERTLVLPVAALRGDSAGADGTVWLAPDGRVEARKVRLGLRSVDAVEVLQGLAEGDAVLLGSPPPPGSRVRSSSAR